MHTSDGIGVIRNLLQAQRKKICVEGAEETSWFKRKLLQDGKIMFQHYLDNQ